MLVSPLARVAYCIKMRDATRLTYTSGVNKPRLNASKKPAEIFQKARAWRSSCPAANPKLASRRSLAAFRSPSFTSFKTAWSSWARAGGPYSSGAAVTSSSGSRKRRSAGHRSAGCTRATPVNACTSRYCGNKVTGDTGLPASTLSRYSLKAKLARSSAPAASSVHSSGRCTNFCTAASMARSTRAGESMPTISSAPLAWCNCWRAMRSGPASSAARSESRATSASWTKRRSALTAPSRDLPSSSSTQASGPRSCSPCAASMAGVFTASLTDMDLFPAAQSPFVADEFRRS